MPLFADPPPTQCTATATCIDHPPTIDLSRIAGALPGSPPPSSLDNVPIPAHDHVVGTRNGGLPEWWNVEVVATTDPATFATPDQHRRHHRRGRTRPRRSTAPTNVSLFFQVLPGTVPAAQAADLTATAPPGARGRHRAQPRPDDEPDRARHEINNLQERLRGHGTELPEHRHQPRLDRRPGRDALYTEPFFCDTTVSRCTRRPAVRPARHPTTVPPGVADQTPRRPRSPTAQIDPLYIPVPLYSSRR